VRTEAAIKIYKKQHNALWHKYKKMTPWHSVRGSAAAGPNKSKRLLCAKKKKTRLGACSRPSAAGAGSFKRGGWRTGDEIDRSSQLAAEIPSLGKTMDHPRLLVIK